VGQGQPEKFGYNGIKGGMSGVGFVVGWVYANTPDGDKLMKGPYDANTKANWDGALGKLKEFNRSVVITPGNAGTLDMLNRGEIAMGPVWVDMFYTWMADGKLPPNMRLQLIGPGLPGQPMYYVIPRRRRTWKRRRNSSRWRPARRCRPRHRQEVQLVSRHRRPAREIAARREDLEQAVRRRHAAGAGEQGQGVPDQAVLRRHLESYERKVLN
jgi:hypothetical protein